MGAGGERGLPGRPPGPAARPEGACGGSPRRQLASQRFLPCPPPPPAPASVVAAELASGGPKMFSWLGTDDRRRKDPEVFQTVSEGLKKLYKTKLLPLEEHYKFHEFHSPALEDADFDNKPMVLLVGQYSTGKTTFIR